MTVSSKLSKAKSLLACIVYNMTEDGNNYLDIGLSKTSFGLKTDHLQSERENTERDRVILNLQNILGTSFSKLLF